MSHPLCSLFGKLSNRTVNALTRDDIDEYGVLRQFRSGEQITISELSRVPDWTLLKVRSFGRICLNDLRRVVPYVGSKQPVDNADWEEAYRLASFGC